MQLFTRKAINTAKENSKTIKLMKENFALQTSGKLNETIQPGAMFETFSLIGSLPKITKCQSK